MVRIVEVKIKRPPIGKEKSNKINLGCAFTRARWHVNEIMSDFPVIRFYMVRDYA